MAGIPRIQELFERMELESNLIKTQQLKIREQDLNEEMTPDIFRFYMSDHDFSDIISIIQILYEDRPHELSTAVKGLVSKNNFYGKYIELLTYRWLHDNQVEFEPEILKKTISKNEVQLDGRFTSAGGSIYFDIKGFDLVNRMTSDLEHELNQKYPDFYFTIGGKTDVSYKDMNKALRNKREHIKTLVDDNKKKEKFSEFAIRKHKLKDGGFYSSHQSFYPYKWAEENEEFFLKNATQYTPDRPFILICTMTTNFLLFDRYTTLRAIARRAFIHLPQRHSQFAEIVSKYEKIRPEYRSAIPCYLSGIIFLNLGQITETELEKRLRPSSITKEDLKRKRAYIFLNPNAKHKLSFARINQLFPYDTPLAWDAEWEDFKYDNY